MLIGVGATRRRTAAEATSTLVEPKALPPAPLSPPESTPRVRTRSRALVFSLCGVLLLGSSFGLFLRVRRSPKQPAVDGRAYLYVNSPTAGATLELTLTGGNRFVADPPARYDVLIVGADKPVRWALVLSGDARLRDGADRVMSAGVTTTKTRVATPPFGGPAVDVQIFHGETRGGFFGGTGDLAFVGGRLERPVARIAEARRTLALPQVGRVVPQVGSSTSSPLPIGVDGSWYIPAEFEAIVDLGRRPLEHRVDLVAPNLADQAVYRWSSPISVRPILGVTDTDQERTEQIVVFLLGVLSAAGLEVLLIAVHQWVSDSG